VTSATGQVREQVALDPFGNRIGDRAFSALDTSPRHLPGGLASKVRLEFTEHENDGELGIVNMRGRVYDARLAKFLSVDPVVADPFDGQAFNAYSYVLNNPTRYTDPSGAEPITITTVGAASATAGPAAPVIAGGIAAVTACVLYCEAIGTGIARGAEAVGNFFGGLFGGGGGKSSSGSGTGSANAQKPPPPPSVVGSGTSWQPSASPARSRPRGGARPRCSTRAPEGPRRWARSTEILRRAAVVDAEGGFGCGSRPTCVQLGPRLYPDRTMRRCAGRLCTREAKAQLQDRFRRDIRRCPDGWTRPRRSCGRRVKERSSHRASGETLAESS
jgi:RHS repeat-associated protein